jgi:hypothetical protein
MQKVNGLLYIQRKDLFYNRKYELHTINLEQHKQDIITLEFLLNLTVQAKTELELRKEELINICVQNGINNPIVGKE